MKSFIRLVTVLSMLFVQHTMFGQVDSTKPDAEQGLHFEVAFGYLWPEKLEAPLPQPTQLFVYALTNASVTVEYGPAGARTMATYDVPARKQYTISLPYAAVIPTLRGIPDSKGISVRSTVPITVASIARWRGNMSMTVHYPVARWGTSYLTFNYPQDQFGPDSAPEYRPGQIVVVASEDDTRITFTSPLSIQIGTSPATEFAADTPHEITLRAHESIALLGVIKPGESHMASTDMTATSIISTKPIAVLSGHTKGAVGNYAGMLPETGLFSASAHFIRNNFYQSLLPISRADTLFATVPMFYTATRTNGQIDRDSVSSWGDVVRILATEDGTIIRRARNDGTNYVLVATINKGQYYTDYKVIDAALWTSSKPSLVMQYGKSYAKTVFSVTAPTSSKHSDEKQGHPTVEAGMPTMMTVPGISQWIRRGVLHAPEGMDNFMTIVSLAEHFTKLGQGIHGLQIGSVRPIGQTGFSYVRTAIGTGPMELLTLKNDVVFMAWSYGSLDGLSQGGAYSHPVAGNYSGVVSSVDDDVNATSGPLSLSLAPQPSSSATSVRYRMGLTSATLRLYDITGAQVLDLSDKLLGDEGTVVLNTSAFARGTYVMRLTDGRHTVVEHIVVE